MSTTEQARHDKLIEALEGAFGGVIVEVQRAYGDLCIVVDRGRVHDVLAALKNDHQFDFLADIAGVDCMALPNHEGPRFDLVYIIYSAPTDTRIQVLINVPEDDMDVPTVTDLWQSANWAEREAFEMFGFNFVGHPCLKRLLTHHEFVGHPLRKDYPVMGAQWCTSTSDMTEELNEKSPEKNG